MKKFFGLFFDMGFVGMPSYRAYWSSSHLYKNDKFSSVMSQERFQSIMRFLHFWDEPQQPDDHLNNTMPEIYTAQKEWPLDQSMMLLRIWLMFRHYIKNKIHKNGVRFFKLCTDDGLVLKIQIYFEQNSQILNHLGRQDLSFYTSWNLPKQMLPLATDNWYNSVLLI